MEGLLKKLKEGRKRILDEKCARWGFNFEQGVPVSSAEASHTTQNEFSDSNDIDWHQLPRKSIEEEAALSTHVNVVNW